jgi:hypothetical protein
MQAVTTIGLDIAKSGFQVHGVDAGAQVVLRRQMKRRFVLAFFSLESCTQCIRTRSARTRKHQFEGLRLCAAQLLIDVVNRRRPP